MAKFVMKIKTFNTKKALSVVVIAGLSALLITSTHVSAQGPQFNIFPITFQSPPPQNYDLPLIDARNVTQGGGYSTSQADHDNGVATNPNDVIRFSIYYHNGVPDEQANTAIQTMIQAFASPTLGTQAIDHTISASISAQNASAISSSNHGGDMVVHIQGGTAQTLSLV
ncbi:hypothetical protein D4R52_01095, partial [bacterium]